MAIAYRFLPPALVVIREKALGASHPDVGQTLNNLASVYRARSKYTEAEGLLKRALVIREKALGASHPFVADTLNLLAGVYQTQGKSGEAEGLIKRVLAIRETALGANHPAAGASLNNLALVYAAQGKLIDALVFAEDRARATSENYRERWESGIRKVKIDMRLAKLAQDKADAVTRAQHKQAERAAYERELAEWEAFKERNPLSLKPRPASPKKKSRGTGKEASDWLPVAQVPSFWR